MRKFDRWTTALGATNHLTLGSQWPPKGWMHRWSPCRRPIAQGMYTLKELGGHPPSIIEGALSECHLTDCPLTKGLHSQFMEIWLFKEKYNSLCLSCLFKIWNPKRKNQPNEEGDQREEPRRKDLHNNQPPSISDPWSQIPSKSGLLTLFMEVL